MALRNVLILALAAACLAAQQAKPLSKSPQTFEIPPSAFPLPAMQGGQKLTAPTKHTKRVARSIAASDPTPNVNTVELLDLYERGFLHWVGNSSQVALLLTYSNRQQKFDFYRSTNYNQADWVLSNDLFHTNSDISTLAASAVNTNNVMFEESDGSGVWSSNDAAATVTFHPTSFTVAPETLSFSPYMSQLVTVQDSNKQVHYSFDLGATWNVLSTPHGEIISMAALSWGAPTDDCDVLFVQHSDGHVYQFALSSKGPSGITWLTNEIASPQPGTFVLDMEYLFVEADTETDDVDLYVSFNRSAFSKASFPGPPRTMDFIIVDASEHMAIVAVQHADNMSNLYISARHGLHFSLSLSNVLLVDRQGIKVVDFQRILGLEGLYLATQLTPGAVHHQYFETMMTFDKGGIWNRVEAPIDSACEAPDCALNFHMQYSHSDPRMRVPAVYSTPAAPGYLLANGNLGPNLYNGGQAYFSSDAGLSWDEVAPTLSQFHMLDSGSVIILGPENFFTPATFLNYSVDDGTTWQSVTLDVPVYVIAMLSEPGNRALKFVVAGVDVLNISRWVIATIDFAPVLPTACVDADYYYWSPRDESEIVPCVLGADIHVQRRSPDRYCYNGYSFVRNETSTICECAPNDIECDYGFARVSLMSPCLAINNSIPVVCTAPGQIANVSLGYRLVSDDVCEGGESAFLQPIPILCPSYPNVPTAPTTNTPTPITTTTTTTGTSTATHTTAAPSRSSDSNNNHSSAGLIAGLVIAMMLLVIAGVVIFVLLRRRGAKSEAVRYAPLQGSADNEATDRDEDMLAF